MEGYLNFLLLRREELSIGGVEVCSLFGNLESVFAFRSPLLAPRLPPPSPSPFSSRDFYGELDGAELSVAAMASVFLKRQAGFAVYASYCTRYPDMMDALAK